jgi:hypothetical protein
LLAGGGSNQNPKSLNFVRADEAAVDDDVVSINK